MAYRKKQIPDRAKVVKKELVDLGMTQRELARELGMNEKYLTDILNGRKPGNKYWDQIEYTLGINQRDTM